MKNAFVSSLSSQRVAARRVTVVTSSEYIAQTARRLAGIFGQVLNQPSYSPSADFFSHGGQSLLLFRLLQLVKTEFDCDIQLVDLLQHPTPLALAQVIISAPQQTGSPPQHGPSHAMLEPAETTVTCSLTSLAGSTETSIEALISASPLAGFDLAGFNYLDSVPRTSSVREHHRVPDSYEQRRPAPWRW